MEIALIFFDHSTPVLF